MPRRFLARYTDRQLMVRGFLAAGLMLALVVLGMTRIDGGADAHAAVQGALGTMLVYSRVPRSQKPVDVMFSGTRYRVEQTDVWDRLPDVKHNMHGFTAEGQLVLRLRDGRERIIYDCTGKPCTPFDAMPSLDGKRIAFAVYRSDNFSHTRVQGKPLPNRFVGEKGSESQIFIYDIASGDLTAWPHEPGRHDNSPIFLKNGRMMFASDRAGVWGPDLRRGVGSPVMQLYTARDDGTNPINISPHQMSNAQHPYLLSTGRVIFGEQWLIHNLPFFYNNGSPGMFTTRDNTWVVSDMDQRGGDATTLLGGHRNFFKDYRRRELKALHFLTELDNGDICTANYYRGNNSGLGMILCWPPEPYSVEGSEPHFLPKGIYSLAEWTTHGDVSSRTIDGEFGGKLGFPEGHPDGILVTRGRGYCLNYQTNIPKLLSRLGGQQGCDTGIYLVENIPSKHPDDLTPVVDSPAWHEFNARVVRPRKIADYPVQRTADGSCVVGSSNAAVTDAHDYTPEDRYRFNNRMKAMANHGTELRGSKHSEMVAIRFYAVARNNRKNPPFANTVGNRVQELGEAPLLSDGSFSARVPCNQPFVMAGINADGLVIKRDQLPQSLRRGEKKTCAGCHLHGSKARNQKRPFDKSLANITPPVNLMQKRPIIRYRADIKPILKRRCASCHASDWVPLFNYDRLVWDNRQESLPVAKRAVVEPKRDNARRWALNRPNTSKYVNNALGLESLLYWKAAGRRADGRTDATYDDDIDFGAAHPSPMTAAELDLLARWLDSGASR